MCLSQSFAANFEAAKIGMLAARRTSSNIEMSSVESPIDDT